MKSGGEVGFHSAFLELYTHQLLLATGHSVEFHPEIAGTMKRPDFLATDASGKASIFECTVATEESVADRAGQERLNALYESIDKVKCDDIFLDLRVSGVPETPVPGRRWCIEIQRWVDSLDYDALLAMGPVDDERPKVELEHDGLHLTIKPIPKKPSARRKGQRPIGVQSFDGSFVTSHKQIRDAVRDKAGRYGILSRPYVVVVNCLGVHADSEEIYSAFFGHAGLWRQIEQPKHTRVSAVLALRGLLPWSIAVTEARLFRNPNSANPYMGPLTVLPQSTLNSQFEGVHVHEALRLDHNWPRD